MKRGKRRLPLIIFLLATVCFSGCAYMETLGIQKKQKERNDKELIVKDEIYATLEEPQSVIKNYAGMVEDENVDWVWVKPDAGFGKYRTVAVTPFRNLSFANAPQMAELLTEQVSSLLQKAGMTVAKDGEMIVDGAIVDVIPKSGIIERIGKILPGDFEDPVFTVSVEVVMGDAATNSIFCKIRHQVSAPEMDAALKKIADDVVQYISLHR